uniref:Uncharacterized protein n=1 Tax=Rhizophora mucronata TaxID=61149 RepID=A0A2P2LGX7_RHIMU
MQEKWKRKKEKRKENWVCASPRKGKEGKGRKSGEEFGLETEAFTK